MSCIFFGMLHLFCPDDNMSYSLSELFLNVGSQCKSDRNNASLIIVCKSPRVCNDVARLIGSWPWRSEFFFCTHANSWTGVLSSINFCMNMYLDNRTKPNWISRSKVHVIFSSLVHQFFSLNVEKIVVANAVFRLSIAWSVPEIFTIKV